MSVKDLAINIVNAMSEEQLHAFVCLFSSQATDIPNDETMLAIEEAEEMLKNPNTRKFYSVEELFAELES